MGDAVELAFRRAASRLIDSNKRWVVAVSGGSDSIALLHLLGRFFGRRREQLIVAHLDHGLRRGSKADAAFVAREAAGLGLTLVSDRREVEGERRRDESLVEAARRVRRTFLQQTRRTSRAEGVVTGHTLDDQAETVLMRLARGAGATGLAGIAESKGRFVRPLLHLERQALRDWLQRHRHTWREDPSNRDLRFDRNRVRLSILPLLQQQLNPRAARHLARAAESLRADAEFLDGLAEERLTKISRADRRGRPVLQASALAALPTVLSQRVALAALKRAGIDARRAGRKHIDALLDLTGAPGGREIHLPGRLRAYRVRGEIRFEEH